MEDRSGWERCGVSGKIKVEGDDGISIVGIDDDDDDEDDDCSGKGLSISCDKTSVAKLL